MVDILLDFELTAGQLNPWVLVGPGVGAVAVGLFLWLGGLGFQRLLIGLAGAVSGFVCGLVVFGHSIMVSVAMAGAAATAAVILKRFFVAILTGILATVVCLAILGGKAAITPEISQAAKPVKNAPAEAERLDIRQSIDQMRNYATTLGTETRKIVRQLPTYRLAIAGVSGLVFLGIGWFFRHFSYALCNSALGVMLITMGMIFLLSYKGSGPVSYLCQKKPLWGITSLAMTGFGTAEQLLLCRGRQKKKDRKKGKKNRDKGETIGRSWRGM